MSSGRSEAITQKCLGVVLHAGVVAGVLALILVAGATDSFAGPDPRPGDDPAVTEAVNQFDQAQSAATAAAPSNRTSKGLEDKLDEAVRNQEEVDANPKATAKQKADAEAAREKAEETADFFNGNAADPDAAENYREKLEERRAARAKLKEQWDRWMKARKAPRTAARALALINSRLRLANEKPPSDQQVGQVPTDADAVALRTGFHRPSVADLRDMRETLIQSQTGQAVHIPYAATVDPGARSQRESTRLMNGLVAQRAADRERSRHDDWEEPQQRDRDSTAHRDPEPVRSDDSERWDNDRSGASTPDYEQRRTAAPVFVEDLEYRHR